LIDDPFLSRFLFVLLLHSISLGHTQSPIHAAELQSIKELLFVLLLHSISLGHTQSPIHAAELQSR